MLINGDHHVHSTVSDGKNTPLENVRQAEAIGLQKLTLVEHVRADTDWVDAFETTLQSLQQKSHLELRGGLEAKLLRANGLCDVPAGIESKESMRLYLADHRFIYGDQAITPAIAKQHMCAKKFSLANAVEMVVQSTMAAMERYPASVIAHLFSILPKIGASEEEHISEEHLRALARCAKKNACIIEIDERWRCPSLRTALFFVDEGVEVLASSDAHRKEDIGQYTHVRDVYEGITKHLARTHQKSERLAHMLKIGAMPKVSRVVA